jgi:hypothetical protein
MLDADDPVVLRGYADTKALEPVSANTVDIRLKAVQVAPQVSLYRLEAAKALIATNDLDIARAVLLPLAASPHQDDMADAAQALLKAIDARKAAAVSKPESDKKS